MGQSIRICFRKYLAIDGRASRSEFWWFQIFRYLMLLIPIVGWAMWVITLPSSLAVMVRRLHDRGHSGLHLLVLSPIPVVVLMILSETIYKKELHTPWPVNIEMIFMSVILLIASFIFCYLLLLIFWLLSPGKVGVNRYGKGYRKLSTHDRLKP
ncbi:MAG: DUF805 domain-containing protein [Alphaproteobacteria bacterium]|nr:DUF805 domain-containing protein [Alphaproteobacteria bacterium]